MKNRKISLKMYPFLLIAISMSEIVVSAAALHFGFRMTHHSFFLFIAFVFSISAIIMTISLFAIIANGNIREHLSRSALFLAIVLGGISGLAGIMITAQVFLSWV